MVFPVTIKLNHVILRFCVSTYLMGYMEVSIIKNFQTHRICADCLAMGERFKHDKRYHPNNKGSAGMHLGRVVRKIASLQSNPNKSDA